MGDADSRPDIPYYSNKAVTVQFGAIGKGQGTSRDGGDYVPGKNGFSTDKTFYFTIPYQVTQNVNCAWFPTVFQPAV